MVLDQKPWDQWTTIFQVFHPSLFTVRRELKYDELRLFAPFIFLASKLDISQQRWLLLPASSPIDATIHSYYNEKSRLDKLASFTLAYKSFAVFVY